MKDLEHNPNILAYLLSNIDKSDIILEKEAPSEEAPSEEAPSEEAPAEEAPDSKDNEEEK